MPQKMFLQIYSNLNTTLNKTDSVKRNTLNIFLNDDVKQNVYACFIINLIRTPAVK